MAAHNPKDQKAIDKLGATIRFKRVERGLTIVRLAELCEVEYTTISKIERGLVNTTISMIVIIARALKIPPSQLLTDC